MSLAHGGGRAGKPDPPAEYAPLWKLSSDSVTPRRGSLSSYPGGNLRATLQPHFRQQRRDVIFHGLLGHAELLSDLPIRQTVADEIQNLALRGRQVSGGVLVIDAPAGQGSLVQQNAPIRNRLDDIRNLRAANGFQNVRAPASRDSARASSSSKDVRTTGRICGWEARS